MKKLLQILAKLGIFRFGSYSGTYKNAKERPDEMLLDGVFNSKKDLSTKGDLKKIVVSAGASSMARNILFFSVIIFAIFFVLMSFGGGFSIFFIITIFWGVFIFFLKKSFLIGQFSFSLVVLFFVVITIISIMIIPNDNSSSVGSDLDQYDRKVFKIVSQSGKLNGYANVVAKKTKKGVYLSVYYNVIIKDDFPANDTCPYSPVGCEGHHYNYVNDLIVINKLDVHEGSLSPVFCHKGAGFDPNLRAMQSSVFRCEGDDLSKAFAEETNMFATSLSASYNSFEEFMSTNEYKVYDGADFQYEVKEDEHSSNWLTDYDKAIKEGKLVGDYIFELKEEPSF